jgi:predicted ATPase
MTQLLSASLKGVGLGEGFPFSVPVIRSLDLVELDVPVSLFVGENGSGKSTLLEAIALAADLPAVGSGSLAHDPTLKAQRRLAGTLRLAWRGRTRRGFFLRAEDFFGFQKAVAARRVEHEAEMGRLDRELKDASALARSLALGVHRGSIQQMAERYGEDPDARSHGEAFLALLTARLVPQGLFLLDEPEAALSPQSQLAFLAMVREAVLRGGQFIIATHSPILMAIPGARVFLFDGGGLRIVGFEELESVTLVREFLNAPDRYLRHLWPDESPERDGE